jgi:hypothetical protein
MSPMELLGLIAEAAGTKMYEAKKDAALKTIEKKQAKVEEIHKVFRSIAIPTSLSNRVRMLLCDRFYLRISLRNWKRCERRGRSTCNGLPEIVNASGYNGSVRRGNSFKPRYPCLLDFM